MLFGEVIGQDRLKGRLRAMVDSGRVAHAQLYTGGSGVGKLPLALATAQYLCCRDRRGGEACGVCASCRKMARLEHPDLHFVFPISKGASGGVAVCDDEMERFREVVLGNPYVSLDEWMGVVSGGKQCQIYANESDEIIRKLSYKPYESDHKIMVIWGAERMNEVCANKVLKVLEEPPGDTVFMLISRGTEGMLGTITSRCQQVAVPPIERVRLEEALRERYDMGEEDVEFYSRNAMGSWGEVQRLMSESEEMVRNFELFKEMMRSAFVCDVRRLRLWSEEVAGLGRDAQLRFMQNAQRLMRENFVARLGCGGLNYMSRGEVEFAERFAPFIHERNIVPIMEELSRAEGQIGQNGNTKIVLFHTGIMLYTMLKISRV